MLPHDSFLCFGITLVTLTPTISMHILQILLSLFPREVIMQSRPALYCCVRWLRTSEAELDNAHWTHGLTVAWPYMHFSFSVWEATTITIAMPRWCGPTGPKQLAVTWMGYLCFKGYSFFVKGAVLVTLRLLPKCAFCSFKIQFTVPFITFLYFNCTTKLATRL